MLLSADELERIPPADLAVGEGAEHVAMRDRGHVPRGIQARHRRFPPLVDPNPRSAVPAAKADLRNRHLDQIASITDPAPSMESAAARALRRMQNSLDLANGLRRQMIHLEIDGTICAVEFPIKLPHHLPAPVVRKHEAISL